MASAISACTVVPVGSDRRFSHPGPRSLRRRPLPRWTSVKASAAAGASRTGERKEAEEILADFLRDTAGEHFDISLFVITSSQPELIREIQRWFDYTRVLRYVSLHPPPLPT